MDTGSTTSIASGEICKDYEWKSLARPVEWMTKNGVFHTHKYTVLKLVFADLLPDRTVYQVVHIDERMNGTSVPYDVILGMDAVTNMPLVVDGRYNIIRYEDRRVPFVKVPCMDIKVQKILDAPSKVEVEPVPLNVRVEQNSPPKKGVDPKTTIQNDVVKWSNINICHTIENEEEFLDGEDNYVKQCMAQNIKPTE